MARTDAPMFTTEDAARQWHRPLPAHHIILAGEGGYWAAAAEVEAAVSGEWMAGSEIGDDMLDQMQKSVTDAVNNAWQEGMTHDEWVSAALRALRDAGSDLILVRSDEGNGGWSLHAAGSTDEQIAEGDAHALLTGDAEMVNGEWNAPTQAHRAAAALMAR